jgi:hypothetical protein
MTPRIDSGRPIDWGKTRLDVAVPFTRESWRGRIRASRGVGASMSPEQVAAFDSEHAELLDRIAPPAFRLTHRVDACILRFP